MLEEMAAAGAELTHWLMGNPAYLDAARAAIPPAYSVAGETAHPHFLTADFALVRDGAGQLVPRLVEIQAFPSVYAYQAALCDAYSEVFNLPGGLGSFLSGMDEEQYWALLARTVLGSHDPENVVLTEVDPGGKRQRPTLSSRRSGWESPWWTSRTWRLSATGSTTATRPAG